MSAVYTVKVDHRGRICLPATLRRQLHIQPGDQVCLIQIGRDVRLVTVGGIFDALIAEAEREIVSGRYSTLDDVKRELGIE